MKGFSVGWLGTIKEWGQWVTGHKNTTAAAHSTYRVVTGLFDQVSALPRVVYSAVTHPPTRKVAKHLAHIAGDLTVYITVTYGATMLFQKIFSDDQTDNPQEPDTSWFNGALVVGFYTIEQLIALRNILKIQGHLLITNIEATELNIVAHPAKLCTNDCRPMDTLEGIAGYWATELAITAIQRITPSGIPSGIMALARMGHNGRYLLSSALPLWCDAHKRQYLIDNSELALSLGIGHAISWRLAVSLIEKTGIPPAYYSNVIDMLMLIVQMSIVGHMNLPKPKECPTHTLDPLGLYQEAVAFSVETFILGLERKIPRMIEARPGVNTFTQLLTNMSWTRTSNVLVTIWQNKIAYIILPTFLQNLDKLAKDSLVRDSLPAFQRSTIRTLRNIENGGEYWLVKIASRFPWGTGVMVNFFFGVPVFATKVMLQNKESVTELAHTFRLLIENMQAEAPQPVTIDLKALQTDGYVPPTPTNSDLQKPPAASSMPSVVIRRLDAPPAPTSGNTDAAKVIKIPANMRYRFPTPPREAIEPAPKATTEDQDELTADDWVMPFN